MRWYLHRVLRWNSVLAIRNLYELLAFLVTFTLIKGNAEIFFIRRTFFSVTESPINFWTPKDASKGYFSCRRSLIVSLLDSKRCILLYVIIAVLSCRNTHSCFQMSQVLRVRLLELLVAVRAVRINRLLTRYLPYP